MVTTSEPSIIKTATRFPLSSQPGNETKNRHHKRAHRCIIHRSYSSLLLAAIAIAYIVTTLSVFSISHQDKNGGKKTLLDRSKKSFSSHVAELLQQEQKYIDPNNKKSTLQIGALGDPNHHQIQSAFQSHSSIMVGTKLEKNPRQQKTATPPPRNYSNAFKNTCDVLFGQDSVSINGACRHHKALKWVICPFPPLRFVMDKISGPAGNESVAEVMGRAEEDERLVFQEGAIEVATSLDEKMMSSTILGEVRTIFTSIKQIDNFKTTQSFEKEDITTIFVVREAYANPCWAIITIYQTWLLIQEFAIEKFRIIWLDGHAHTPMDSMWPQLFGPNVYHLKNFVNVTSRTDFPKSFLVQAAPTAMSNEGLKLHRKAHTCTPNSRLDQFRNWVLKSYGLLEPGERIHSTGVQPKSITLLVRRNYVAHPRSDGIVDRTLHRLNETVAALEKRYPDDKVQVVSFESIPVAEQLSIIARTDLLLAVHGAGNVHAIFLQPGSVFVEFFPKGFESRRRFKFLALYVDYEGMATTNEVERGIANCTQLNVCKVVIGPNQVYLFQIVVNSVLDVNTVVLHR